MDNWPFVLQRQNDYASLFNTWILWCSCQSLHRVTRWHKLLYPWMTEYVYSSLHWPLVWPLLYYCFWRLVSTVCNKIKKRELKFSEHKIDSMVAGNLVWIKLLWTKTFAIGSDYLCKPKPLFSMSKKNRNLWNSVARWCASNSSNFLPPKAVSLSVAITLYIPPLTTKTVTSSVVPPSL